MAEQDIPENYIRVGHVSDAHGLKGELYILIASGDTTWIKDLKTLQVKSKKINGDFKPLKIRPHKKGFVCFFDGVSDRTAAEKFIAAEIWVSADLFVSTDGDQPFLSELLDFQVTDIALGAIGPIIDFSTNGSQDLLIVQTKDQSEVEIPFVKDFVVHLDFENKTIQMNLPEGLLQINDKMSAEGE